MYSETHKCGALSMVQGYLSEVPVVIAVIRTIRTGSQHTLIGNYHGHDMLAFHATSACESPMPSHELPARTLVGILSGKRSSQTMKNSKNPIPPKTLKLDG